MILMAGCASQQVYNPPPEVIAEYDRKMAQAPRPDACDPAVTNPYVVLECISRKRTQSLTKAQRAQVDKEQALALAKIDAEEKQLATERELILPPSQQNCGLLGCVSSPYLKAKLSPDLIGHPVSEAIGLAGAPDNSVPIGNVTYLTWRRVQRDGSALYACQETVSVRDNRIGGYRFEGNC